MTNSVVDIIAHTLRFTYADAPESGILEAAKYIATNAPNIDISDENIEATTKLIKNIVYNVAE